MEENFGTSIGRARVGGGLWQIEGLTPSLARSVFKLSAIDHSHLGFPPPARSLACLGLALLALDPCHLGPPVSLRTPARFGLPTPAPGLGRLGASPLALDSVHLESFLPLRSFA